MSARRWRTLAACGMLLAGGATALVAKDDVWLRVTSPEFTLITSLNEKEAGAWSAEFAQYVAALRNYFSNDQRRLPPLTVVVFARERDFEKYRPLGADGKPQGVAGFFSRHESWAVAGLGGANASEEVRRTIFHEGVHWFLSLQDRQNPVWLEEGLAEVFSTFNVTRTQAEWGRAIASHVILLRNGSIDSLSLEKVLFTSHGDLFGDDSLRTSIVYAKSWAFVHFLIYGKHDIPRHALGDYADLVQNGLNPDEAFRRAFGKTYRQMDDLLDDYLRRGQYFVSKQPLMTVSPPKIDPASRLEVEDALGRLAFSARRWAFAAEHARAEIAAADGDPRGHELLGRALKESGDSAGSLAEFTRATELDSQEFAPYFELAYAAQTAAADPGGGLSLGPVDARRIANNYERAIKRYPRYVLSYQNLAGVIGVAEPWGESDRQFFALGQKYFPRDAMIRIGRAVLLRRGGDHPAAQALLDEVHAPDFDAPAGARAYARRLDEGWEQQDVFAQVNHLGEARKFDEALALIDERLEHGVSAALRPQLLRTRGSLEVASETDHLKQALADRDWVEARRLASALVASSASPQIKQQAHRTLDQLDRQAASLEPAKKQSEDR